MTTTPAVYRQRLTPLGWLGLALAIVCPLASAAISYDWITSPYAQPPNVVYVAALFVGMVVAPVLILIGREYFPFTAPEPQTASAPQSSQRVTVGR